MYSYVGYVVGFIRRSTHVVGDLPPCDSREHNVVGGWRNDVLIYAPL